MAKNAGRRDDEEDTGQQHSGMQKVGTACAPGPTAPQSKQATQQPTLAVVSVCSPHAMAIDAGHMRMHVGHRPGSSFVIQSDWVAERRGKRANKHGAKGGEGEQWQQEGCPFLPLALGFHALSKRLGEAESEI